MARYAPSPVFRCRCLVKGIACIGIAAQLRDRAHVFSFLRIPRFQAQCMRLLLQDLFRHGCGRNGRHVSLSRIISVLKPLRWNFVRASAPPATTISVTPDLYKVYTENDRVCRRRARRGSGCHHAESIRYCLQSSLRISGQSLYFSSRLVFGLGSASNAYSQAISVRPMPPTAAADKCRVGKVGVCK